MHLEEFKNRVLPIKNKLYRFAHRLLMNEDEAKDVVQEVLIKVWNRREEMISILNVDAWCMTVVKNTCLDKLRSRNRHMMHVIDDRFDMQDELDDPAVQIETKDTLNRIHQLIDQLPEKLKMAIQLRDIEGYSYQEITEIMGVDLNQVKVTLFRARKAIREKMLNTDAYGL